MAYVMCHVSCVACHMSPTPTATVTTPTPLPGLMRCFIITK